MLFSLISVDGLLRLRDIERDVAGRRRCRGSRGTRKHGSREAGATYEFKHGRTLLS
jgi:hypothetical protein